jgi:ATP-dependent exoDNAse (exonuclease V) alpha subunit
MDTGEERPDDGLEIVIKNFQKKNKLSETELKRDHILTLHSRYLFKAQEGRILTRAYYAIKEIVLRNSYEFNLYVFNWDSRLHREVTP